MGDLLHKQDRAAQLAQMDRPMQAAQVDRRPGQSYEDGKGAHLDGNVFWEIAYTDTPDWPEPERWYQAALPRHRPFVGPSLFPRQPRLSPRAPSRLELSSAAPSRYPHAHSATPQTVCNFFQLLAARAFPRARAPRRMLLAASRRPGHPRAPRCPACQLHRLVRAPSSTPCPLPLTRAAAPCPRRDSGSGSC